MDGQIYCLHGIGTYLACRISLSFIRSVKDMSSSFSWDKKIYLTGGIKIMLLFNQFSKPASRFRNKLASRKDSKKYQENLNETQLFKQSLKSFLHFEIKTD
jgi:hypothetical protein